MKLYTDSASSVCLITEGSQDTHLRDSQVFPLATLSSAQVTVKKKQTVSELKSSADDTNDLIAWSALHIQCRRAYMIYQIEALSPYPRIL